MVKQRARLPARRATPRRKAPERVQHLRTRPKAGTPPTAQEKRHIARVRALPCLVCGRPSTAHHVTGYADRPGRFARSHRLVVPICAEHHQKVFDPSAAEPVSVEGLGHQGFYRKYGIDLLAEAERLWKESEDGEG